MELVLLPVKHRSSASRVARVCAPAVPILLVLAACGAQSVSLSQTADKVEVADVDTTQDGADDVWHSAHLARGPSVRSVEKYRKAPPADPNEPRELPPLPEGTTVLHVGDSFAGALGLPLNKRLRDAGITSILKYRTASYIVEWANQDELGRHLATYHPDLVLVSLGANELEITEPERRIPAIKKIVATIGDTPCVWVGVPLWNDDHNGLMEIVRDNVAPCRFLDSAGMFPDMPRAHDNIHPTMQAREDWADMVRDWLAEERSPSGQRAWALAAQ